MDQDSDTTEINKLPDYLRDLPDTEEFIKINGLQPNRSGKERSRRAQYNARLNDWGGLAFTNDDLEEILDEMENPYGLKGPIVYFNVNAHYTHGNTWVAFVGVGNATNLRCPVSKLFGPALGLKISSLQIKAVRQGETFNTYYHFVPPQFRK